MTHSSLDECQRAEARVLNLGRTPWHMTWDCSLRNSSRTLLARSWMRRAVVVPSATRTQTTLAATVAGARHVPVGWTVLVECVSRKRDALRDSANGTRLEGRDPRKHGWQPWRGARLRQDQDGSTGKFLADTRAPSSLRRARCGRTPPKSYATAFGLDSAHAPLLAKTHPMNCTSP